MIPSNQVLAGVFAALNLIALAITGDSQFFTGAMVFVGAGLVISAVLEGPAKAHGSPESHVHEKDR